MVSNQSGPRNGRTHRDARPNGRSKAARAEGGPASAALDADHELEPVAVLERVGVGGLGIIDDDHHSFRVGFVEALGEEDIARG